MGMGFLSSVSSDTKQEEPEVGSYEEFLMISNSNFATIKTVLEDHDAAVRNLYRMNILTLIGLVVIAIIFI